MGDALQFELAQDEIQWKDALSSGESSLVSLRVQPRPLSSLLDYIFSPENRGRDPLFLKRGSLDLSRDGRGHLSFQSVEGYLKVLPE